MAQYHLSTTHEWSEQQVSIFGRTFFHRQCQICGRDFARSLNEGEWRAVHVGVIEFHLLDKETTRRWVSEDCPGRRLPDDERIHPGGPDDERIHPGGPDDERIHPGGDVHASSSKRRAGDRGEPTP
jgi:hypothetical protein